MNVREPHNADDLLADAMEMLPRLRLRRSHGEANCSLDPASIAEFREAGFFRVLQPAGAGGLERPAAVLFRLQQLLSHADMSAGWVVANMACVAFHAALFDPAAQDDLWGGTADVLLASSNMPGGRLSRGEGSAFRLSGRWRFASGVEHADWVLLGALAGEDGVASACACLVPRALVAIERDWDVIGLRGTGSHAVRIDDLAVPAHRVLDHARRFGGESPGLRRNTAALYRLPLPQLLFRAISTSSIGGLERMLELFVAENRGRVSAMVQAIAEDPHVQALCAAVDEEAAGMTGAMERDLERFTLLAEAGAPIPLAERRSARMRATRVSERCLHHALELFRWRGASALYMQSEFQFILRDMLAARQHAANQNEAHARAGGAALLGLEREDTLL